MNGQIPGNKDLMLQIKIINPLEEKFHLKTFIHKHFSSKQKKHFSTSVKLLTFNEEWLELEGNAVFSEQTDTEQPQHLEVTCTSNFASAWNEGTKLSYLATYAYPCGDILDAPSFYSEVRKEGYNLPNLLTVA